MLLSCFHWYRLLCIFTGEVPCLVCIIILIVERSHVHLHVFEKTFKIKLILQKCFALAGKVLAGFATEKKNMKVASLKGWLTIPNWLLVYWHFVVKSKWSTTTAWQWNIKLLVKIILISSMSTQVIKSYDGNVCLNVTAS